MRTLLVLIAWLVGLAGVAESEGVHMAADNDVTYLADMAAPPWTASVSEVISSDHAGFEHCEEFAKTFASRPGAVVLAKTYTTSERWGKILRAKMMLDAESTHAMLLTCWLDADGHVFAAAKVDDGEP